MPHENRLVQSCGHYNVGGLVLLEKETADSDLRLQQSFGTLLVHCDYSVTTLLTISRSLSPDLESLAYPMKCSATC
jgi:hypothetical protein